MACRGLLVIADNARRVRLERAFARSDLALIITSVDSEGGGLAAIESGRQDVVLCDSLTSDASAVNLLRRAHTLSPDLPVFLIGDDDHPQAALDAIRAGAADYFLTSDHCLAKIPFLMQATALSGRMRRAASADPHDFSPPETHRQPGRIPEIRTKQVGTVEQAGACKVFPAEPRSVRERTVEEIRATEV